MIHSPTCVDLSPAGTLNRWGSLPSGTPIGVETPVIGPVQVPQGDRHYLTEIITQVQKPPGPVGNTTGINTNTTDDLLLGTNGSSFWRVTGSSGQFYPNSDNANQIGTNNLRVTNFIASSQFLIYSASGDANAAMALSNSALKFGPGGASAVDTAIVRTGTKALKILNDATGSLGFLNATPVTQQTATGATGYADSGATVVHSAGTFTGGVGATAYTIGDIVAALKNYGLLVT